jgi:hypothetical protein
MTFRRARPLAAATDESSGLDPVVLVVRAMSRGHRRIRHPSVS